MMTTSTSRLIARVMGLASILAGLALWVAPARSSWVHDRDADRIDDRITAVNQRGLAASYEGEDVTRRQTIAVFPGSPLRYGIYVGYDHPPTEADAATVRGLGLGGVKPYRYINYVRAEGTFAQILSVAGRPEVVRIEAIPMVYATNHYGSRVVRARDATGLKKSENTVLFPSARRDLGLDGTGIVVAVLDTGVNDGPDDVNPGYPGHESLQGKFLGGGNFFFGDPNLNTGLDETVNPSDRGGPVSSYHATHVAGTILGTGGSAGFFTGVAPAARLVDCKVLSDAGVGFGSADGIEWCIANRDNAWGLSGDDLIYSGIDVLSMSLGGLENSDGTDAGAQMVNAAVEAGLVVCVASGNDGNVDYITSPASADLAITVGASSHGGTLDRGDDQVTDFSNEGPRLDDGDGDHFDEMKPNVVAPGATIYSADGDFTSEGESYHALSGTSMATPHVSGVAALLLQADPDLTPRALRWILQNTAEHFTATVKGDRPDDPFVLDANYDPGCGWGLVDAYAAAKEALDSASGVQVTQIRAIARPQDGAIDVTWITQREHAFGGFHVDRAPDVAGAPGAFVRLTDPIPITPSPEGDPNLQGDDNRTPYVYVDGDPALELGHSYWYRIVWLDQAVVEHGEPPVPVDFGDSPRVATVHYSIVHNEVENDLFIRVGTSRFYDPAAPEFFTLGPGTGEQDSVFVHEPANAATATIGYLEHFWSVGFSAGDGIGAYLPPRFGQAWFLDVGEAGYVNRMGRITSFSMFVNDAPGSPSGTTYFTDTFLPMPTIETESVTAWIPEGNAAGVQSATLAATGEEEGIRIFFELEDRSAGSPEVWIHRALSADPEGMGPVTSGEISAPGGRLEYVDRSVEPGRSYWYWVEFRLSGRAAVLAGPVEARSAPLPFARSLTRLTGANPIAREGSLEVVVGRDVARPGEGDADVRVTVHDVQGRTVRTLVDGPRRVGSHRVAWDTRDDSGVGVPQGTYFVRTAVGGQATTHRWVVLR